MQPTGWYRDRMAVTPKGEATRRRILDAATAEFAERGIAGARVDRIAQVAGVNKAQIYAHFASKDELFDAAFDDSIDRIRDVVPIDGDDLADWAVRLYDDYLVRPDNIRLATWARLERRPTGHLVVDAGPVEAAKLEAIARAQRDGRVIAGLDPHDVMASVIAMSMAWSPVSNVYAATADEPEADHERRRALLRAAVARAFTPS
jgi:AcrR family transcriptional regulator